MNPLRPLFLPLHPRLAIAMVALSAAPLASTAANVSWDLAGSGAFLQPTNWAGDALPLPADTAIVGLAGATATLAAGDTVNVTSLFAQDAGVIQMSGGTVNATTLQGNSSAPASILSTAQLQVTGGSLNLANFQMLNGATATLGGNAVLTARTDIRARGGSSISFSDQVTVNAGKIVMADTVTPAPGGASSASITASGNAVILQSAPSIGSARNELWVGTGREGSLTLSGNASWTQSATSTSSDVVIGRGSVGTLTIQDQATLTVQAGNSNGFNGGGTAIAARVIQVGALANGVGTIHLNGGAIATVGFSRDTGSSGTVATIHANGGTLRALGNQSNFFNGFSGTSSVNLLGGGLKFDTNGFAVTAGNALGGSGGLTKLGGGVLTLGGANTYSGKTTVGNGTLALSSSGSIAASTTLEVQAGATLDVSAVSGWTLAAGQTLGGNGSVIGNVTLHGTLAAGSSPGTLSFANSLAFDGTYAFEFNGAGDAADLVDVGGDLSLLGGTLSLIDLAAGGGVAPGASLTLFAYDGSFSGGFTGLSDGDVFNGAGQTWQLDYDATSPGALNGGAGNRFVTLTAVPEPASGILSGLGLLAVSAWRRRSR